MYKALTLPLLITLFFHALLVAALLFDAPTIEPTVRRAATKYIRAELVTLEKPKQKKKVIKSADKKKAADKAKRLAAQKAQREKAQREKDQREIAQREKEQKQLLKEREDEKKALQQKELEAKQRYEQQQRIQKENERELADAIEQENAQDGGEKQVVTAEELANSYIAYITDTIQNSWNRPPSARNGMVTELALRIMPTGEVVNVNVIKSSGNTAFDRSAENAVRRAGQFPDLQNLPSKVFEDYFRNLRLKFRPEDLRL